MLDGVVAIGRERRSEGWTMRGGRTFPDLMIWGEIKEEHMKAGKRHHAMRLAYSTRAAIDESLHCGLLFRAPEYLGFTVPNLREKHL